MNGTVSRNKYFCESAFYMLEGIPVRKGMFLFFGMRTFFLAYGSLFSSSGSVNVIR